MHSPFFSSWQQFGHKLWRVNEIWVISLRGFLSNKSSMYLHSNHDVCWWITCDSMGSRCAGMQYANFHWQKVYYGLPITTLFISDVRRPNESISECKSRIQITIYTRDILSLYRISTKRYIIISLSQCLNIYKNLIFVMLFLIMICLINIFTNLKLHILFYRVK